MLTRSCHENSSSIFEVEDYYVVESKNRQNIYI